MKNLYIIYLSIDEYEFNQKIKFLLPINNSFRYKHGKMYGMYAWTTKKKIVDEFMGTRKSGIFVVVTKSLEYDDGILSQFEFNYPEYKLSWHKYKENRNDENSECKEIVTTKNEDVIIINEGLAYLVDLLSNDMARLEPNKFKPSIANALDVLGYWNMMFINNGDSNTIDYVSNRLSYGISALGNRTYISEESFVNEYLLLLYLYSALFF